MGTKHWVETVMQKKKGQANEPHAKFLVDIPKRILYMKTDESRLGICQDRRDRRSCKIFPNCVKFWGNNANSLGNSS